MLVSELNELVRQSPPAALVAGVIDRAVRDAKSSDPVRASEALFWLLTSGPDWLALTGFEIDRDLFLDKVVTL
jgi:hypothetical protein